MSTDHETEWEVLRGPLPLEHRGPVDGGLLGTLVGRSKLLLRVGSIALAIVAPGAIGGVVAIRNYYVALGAEMRDRQLVMERLQKAEREICRLKNPTNLQFCD